MQAYIVIMYIEVIMREEIEQLQRELALVEEDIANAYPSYSSREGEPFSKPDAKNRISELEKANSKYCETEMLEGPSSEVKILTPKESNIKVPKFLPKLKPEDEDYKLVKKSGFNNNNAYNHIIRNIDIVKCAKEIIRSITSERIKLISKGTVFPPRGRDDQREGETFPDRELYDNLEEEIRLNKEIYKKGLMVAIRDFCEERENKNSEGWKDEVAFITDKLGEVIKKSLSSADLDPERLALDTLLNYRKYGVESYDKMLAEAEAEAKFTAESEQLLKAVNYAIEMERTKRGGKTTYIEFEASSRAYDDVIIRAQHQAQMDQRYAQGNADYPEVYRAGEYLQGKTKKKLSDLTLVLAEVKEEQIVLDENLREAFARAEGDVSTRLQDAAVQEAIRNVAEAQVDSEGLEKEIEARSAAAGAKAAVAGPPSVPTLPKDLVNAVELGDADRVTQLLAAGADVNVKNVALMNAAVLDHEGVVTQLLAAGADVNAVDTEGVTALMNAAMLNHGDVVKNLMQDDKIDLERKDENGYTALIIAAGLGHEDVVTQLLAAGADVNAVDKTGNTALEMANQRGHEDVVNILTAHVKISQSQQAEGVEGQGQPGMAVAQVCERGRSVSAATNAAIGRKASMGEVAAEEAVPALPAEPGQGTGVGS
jgi:hypothetical protein